ncbi:MAG: DUF192 domain-containing protein [Dongiaceae bacterium]
MMRYVNLAGRLSFVFWVLLAATQWMSAVPAAALDREILVIRTATKSYPFNVEIADDENARARGLMFRNDMAANAGMLFIYPQDQAVTFWMRNTYLSLDMIFIAADGRITQIVKRAQPLSEALIPSDSYIRAVLEVNGGITDQLGIHKGDQVDYKAFKSPASANSQ